MVVETLLNSFSQMQRAIRYTAPVSESSLPCQETHADWSVVFHREFRFNPSNRKYRATSHKYKLSIIGNSVVTTSSLKNDDSFLSLTSYESIINGSLDSNFLIGQCIF
ncbi:unnamed protein product [Brassica oleracea]